MGSPFLYPAISLTGGPYKPSPHTVAEFFNLGDAESFAMRENLYVGKPRYDRRESGYRFTPEPVVPSYREWCAQVDANRVPILDLDSSVIGDPFKGSLAA